MSSPEKPPAKPARQEPTPAEAARLQREKRLASALRDNLRRRKAGGRAAVAADDAGTDGN